MNRRVEAKLTGVAHCWDIWALSLFLWKPAWIDSLSNTDNTKPHIYFCAKWKPWLLFAPDLARYREINQKISVDPVTSEHELTCQAEGYPEAEVIWTSRDHQQLSGETTITNSKRKEKLLNVTSTLRINTTANEIFYCTFRGSSPEENSTAELVIPGDILNVSITMCLELLPDT